MPASPSRRLDAGMIGSLVACYPLNLFEANDARILDTIAALKEFAWLEDSYFNHVGHSAFGTYLSLHVAQCELLKRDRDAWKIINWEMRHASPTFTWAEGIHPLTRGGAMGDGHHGWALADFLLIVRNVLLFEENDHLVLTPILPEEWTNEMNVIKVEDAPTYFGTVKFHNRVRTARGDTRRQCRMARRVVEIYRMELALPIAPSRRGYRERRNRRQRSADSARCQARRGDVVKSNSD